MNKLRKTLLASCLFFGTSGIATGQTLNWDITPGDGATITGGAGTWDTSNTNWNSSGTNVNWTNGSTTAVFGGTSGIVTLGENITAGGLTFSSANYSIGATGGTNTLTLTSGSIINKNAAATINANLISSGAISIAGNSNLTLNGNNSGLTGGVTVGGANTVFLGNANALGTGTITIASGTQPAIGFNSSFTVSNAIDLQGIIWSAGSQTNSYSGPITVTGANRGFMLWTRDINQSGTVALGANSLSIDRAGANLTMTMSGIVSGAGGGIVKRGTDTTLVLSGNNTFTGGVAFRGGTIRVGTNNTALGTGTLTVNSADAPVNTSQTNMLATASGGGARNLSNNVVINNNGTGITTLNLDGGFANLTLSGVISGNGGIQTSSSGNVFLVGSNTYTGSTVLTGTNRLVLSGATNTSGIVVGSGNSLALRSITVNAPISGAGVVTKDIGTFGASTVNGNNTYTGATIVNIDRFSVGVNGIINGTSSIAVQAQWGANFNNLGSVTTAGNITIAGTASATTGGTSGGVTTDSSFFRNSGTVNASNIVLNSSPSTATGVTANRGGTYSQTAGTTTLTGALTLAANGGTGAAGTLGNDAAFNLSGGAFSTPSLVLNAGTANITGGTLNIGSGGITGTNTNTAFNLGNATLASTAAFNSAINMNLNSTATINSNGGNIDLTGTVAGTGSMTKAGGNSLTLTGSNAYNGTTTVSAGTLIINGVHTGGAAYSVDGTLKGTGSIDSAVTVNSSGTLSPGASVESLSMGALTMSSGSTFVFEGDSLATEQADLLRVNGDLSLSGVTLNMVDLDSIWSPTAKFTLISYGGTAISGGFTGFLDDTDYNFGGSNLWRLDYNDTVAGTNFVSEATAPHSPAGTQFVTITAVPEPSGLIFGATMIGCFLYRRRKTSEVI